MKFTQTRSILKIIVLVVFIYLYITYLLQVRLHDSWTATEEHGNLHISDSEYPCYTSHHVNFNATVNSSWNLPQTDEKCYRKVLPVNVQMEEEWQYVDVSYPIKASVSGWVDIIKVKTWSAKLLKVIIVPHSHQDPGWLYTFDGYYSSMTKKTIDLMIRLLSKHQDWRFVWSEVCFLSKWWDTAPKKLKQDLKRLISIGQLEIVSGGWVMSDEASVHYIPMLNQLVDGHRWLLDNLGVRPNVSWSIDPFGHSPTMAYLQKRNNLSAMVIQRIHFGIKRHFARSKHLEFLWRQVWAEDKSTDILTHVMPFLSYAIPHSCGPDSHICCQFDFEKKKCYRGSRLISPIPVDDKNVDKLSWSLWEQFQKKSELFRSDVVLVPHGDDFRYSTEKEWTSQLQNLERLMQYMNHNAEMNIQVRFGTLSDYFNELKKTKLFPYEIVDFPTFSGDFFPYADRKDQYWTGFYSSRPHYKYLSAQLQSLLRSVEILYALLLAKVSKNRNRGQRKMLGSIASILYRTKQEVSLFQHHDAITGTSRSHVMKDYGQRMLNAHEKLTDMCQSLLSIGLQYEPEEQDHHITVADEWTNVDDLPVKKTFNISRERKLIIYNSLVHNRQEVIKININTWKVKVIDISSSKVIPHQLSPIWTKKGFSVSACELAFIVNLPPLSLSVFSLLPEESHSPATEVFSFKDDLQISHSLREFSFLKTVAEPLPATFEIYNYHLNATFFTCNGRLQHISRYMDGKTIRSELKIMTYSTGGAWSNPFKDKSGAYTFVPDGAARTLSQPLVGLFKVDGPIYSRVITIQSAVTQVVTLYKSAGPVGQGIGVEHYVEMQDLDNTELVLRVESNLMDKENTICVDLNGFQMHRKRLYSKRKIQGNFFPATTMAYIENQGDRMTLLMSSSRGVASLAKGWIEVILDRRLNQDDWRGLSEGVTDNVMTKSEFILLFEISHSSKMSPMCHPSLAASRLSDQMNNPNIIAMTPVVKRTFKLPPVMRFLQKEFPCDIFLVNIKLLFLIPDTNNSLGDFLFTIHRRQFDCDMQSYEKDTCAKTLEIIPNKMFSLFNMSKMTETSLSGTHLIKFMPLSSAITVPKMEIKSYKVVFG